MKRLNKKSCIKMLQSYFICKTKKFNYFKMGQRKLEFSGSTNLSEQ